MQHIYSQIIFLSLCSSLMAQVDTIELEQIQFDNFHRYSQELDSNRMNNDTLYEYFSFISTTIIPTLRNSESINFEIKTIKDKVIISQYDIDKREIYWSKQFDNNASYPFVFYDSTSQEQILKRNFKLRKANSTLTIVTNEIFSGEIKVEDTLINFIVYPFILSKNNIRLKSSSQNKLDLNNILLYGEAFKVKGNYYTFTDFNIKNNTIIVRKINSELGKYGYKVNFTIDNFELIKKRIKTEATKKVTDLESEYYLFYFWGEWCYPCQKKIAYNKEFYKKIDTTRLKYINIALSLTDESKRRTLKLIKEKNINGVHLIEGKKDIENGFISRLNNISYPTSILVDKEGQILYRSDNFSKVTLEQFLRSRKLLK